MKRREFLGLVGSAAAWPATARAQQPIPLVGFLYIGMPEDSVSPLTGFRAGLSETGYVEGRNVTVEYRWAYNDNSRLPELAADLVRRQVAVIATPASTATALAAKAATRTIPIVFGVGSDPVAIGLVTSLSRPNGNVTGVTAIGHELDAKRLELMRELAPAGATIAILLNPRNADAKGQLNNVNATARVLGQQIHVLNASTEQDVEAAFATLSERRISAVVVAGDALFNNQSKLIAMLAARHSIPAIQGFRDFAIEGGLISYGARYMDNYRQVGVYVGRILKGEKPGDLPVIQSSKIEMVINLKAAKKLGIAVPLSLLGRADEVIE